MGQPIKLIIKKGAVRNDGTSLIFLQYCHSADKRVLLSTGVAIPPRFWNKKTGRVSENLPSEFGDIQKLQSVLIEHLRKAEDMIEYALAKTKICPMQFLKTNFSLPSAWALPQMQETPKELNVFFQIDQYIKEKRDSVRKCTIGVILEMKARLKSFESYRKTPITFDSFDVDFYEAFVRYLTYDYKHLRCNSTKTGLKTNTVGKTIKHLKSFLRNRMQKKIIPIIDLSAYKVMEEDVDAVYLNWREVSVMYHLDLSATPHLEKYRDLFVLGCLTGFRFSDYTDIKPEEIRDDMLYVTQTKTLATVVVPLRPDAKRILGKYNMNMPQVSNPDFNYYIKQVAKLAGLEENIKITHRRGNKIVEEVRPKYAWVMSHTCRRSFCTNEFLAGTPSELIMAISGHKTEKAFRRYIKADKVQKAYMIKKIWDNRPGL